MRQLRVAVGHRRSRAAGLRKNQRAGERREARTPAATTREETIRVEPVHDLGRTREAAGWHLGTTHEAPRQGTMHEVQRQGTMHEAPRQGTTHAERLGQDPRPGRV